MWHKSIDYKNIYYLFRTYLYYYTTNIIQLKCTSKGNNYKFIINKNYSHLLIISNNLSTYDATK